MKIEDLEKDKGKKRKAPSTVPRSIPVRKSARKSFASQVKSKTGGTTTSAEASSLKSKRRPTSAERLAENRLESFSSREIIPERSVDLKSEDTWGYLEVIKRDILRKLSQVLEDTFLRSERVLCGSTRRDD